MTAIGRDRAAIQKPADGVRKESAIPRARGAIANSLLKVEPLLAVMPARIQAVLQFALLIQMVERPVAERDKDDDGDQGEKIAAAAGVLRSSPPDGDWLTQ